MQKAEGDVARKNIGGGTHTGCHRCPAGINHAQPCARLLDPPKSKRKPARFNWPLRNNRR